VAPGEPGPHGVGGPTTRGWVAVVRLQMRVTALAPADLSTWGQMSQLHAASGQPMHATTLHATPF